MTRPAAVVAKDGGRSTRVSRDRPPALSDRRVRRRGCPGPRTPSGTDGPRATCRVDAARPSRLPGAADTISGRPGEWDARRPGVRRAGRAVLCRSTARRWRDLPSSAAQAALSPDDGAGRDPAAGVVGALVEDAGHRGERRMPIAAGPPRRRDRSRFGLAPISRRLCPIPSPTSKVSPPSSFSHTGSTGAVPTSRRPGRRSTCVGGRPSGHGCPVEARSAAAPRTRTRSPGTVPPGRRCRRRVLGPRPRLVPGLGQRASVSPLACPGCSGCPAVGHGLLL